MAYKRVTNISSISDLALRFTVCLPPDGVTHVAQGKRSGWVRISYKSYNSKLVKKWTTFSAVKMVAFAIERMV